MLFSSLDSTIRKCFINNKYFIFVDTVGFIRDLPTTLIDAFKSTLDEILYSDVILHVRDISNERDFYERKEVFKILKEIGIDRKDNRIINVMNKVDLLNYDFSNSLNGNNKNLMVSAITGFGIDNLKKVLEKLLIKTNHFNNLIRFEVSSFS